MNNSPIFGLFLTLLFSICSAAMLFQSYTIALSASVYYISLIAFIAAIISSIILGRHFLAIFGIFLFSIVVRMMYFLRTDFAVFPSGDPYSQFTVLQAFSESSKVSIFPTNNALNFLTEIPYQYSQWPGIQAFAVSFTRVTGISLFPAALIVIPFAIFSVWFLLTYSFLRTILSRISSAKIGGMIAAAAIIIATDQPNFELPPEFKYDFLALTFMLAAILILVKSLDSRHYLRKNLLLVALLCTGIVVTHSLTALYWTLLLVLFVGAVILGPKLAPKTGKLLRLLSASAKSFDPKKDFSFIRLLLLMGIATLTWWEYFATFSLTYIGYTGPSILSSFSLTAIFQSRVPGVAAKILSLLTPTWLLYTMQIRDYFFLGLLLVGALILIMRPAILGKHRIAALLLSVVLISVPAELFQSINFNDRPLLLFSSLLGLVCVIPLVSLFKYRPSLLKVGALIIGLVFLLAVGFGFWGASYAPTYLYSNVSGPYAFGEHPTDWSSAASYLSYANVNSLASANSSCIVTNEIYVTSLVLPLQDLIHTFPYTDIPITQGCLGIIYDSPATFNNSYNIEPYNPYQQAPGSIGSGFSNSAFVNLTLQSNVVFSTTNLTIYYFQSP